MRAILLAVIFVLLTAPVRAQVQDLSLKYAQAAGVYYQAAIHLDVINLICPGGEEVNVRTVKKEIIGTTKNNIVRGGILDAINSDAFRDSILDTLKGIILDFEKAKKDGATELMCKIQLKVFREIYQVGQEEWRKVVREIGQLLPQ